MVGCSSLLRLFFARYHQVPELNTDPLDTASTQAAAGLSRLKGVFQSFNGGVEVNTYLVGKIGFVLQYLSPSMMMDGMLVCQLFAGLCCIHVSCVCFRFNWRERAGHHLQE